VGSTRNSIGATTIVLPLCVRAQAHRAAVLLHGTARLRGPACPAFRSTGTSSLRSWINPMFLSIAARRYK
jgi:hypothetical protein